MKSKAITLLVVTGIVLCLFSCGQPESPSATTTSNVTTGQDTPILLWDWGNNGYSLSMSEDGTTSTPLIEHLPYAIDNFCWEDDGTLWYTTYNDGTNIEELFKKEAGSDSVKISSCNVCDIDYDAANGRFFVVYSEGDYLAPSSYTLKVIDKDVMKTATNLLETAGDAVALTYNESYRYFTAGSAENNTYCAIFRDGWYKDEMRAFTYTPGADAAEVKASYELSTSSELFGSFYSDDGYDYRIFTDIQIADGNIYVLGTQSASCSEGWSDFGNVAISRGGVFKFTLNGTAFVYKGATGLQQVSEKTKEFTYVAWSDFYNDFFTLYADDNGTPFTFEADILSGIPEKNGSTSVLLSPKKFIAIKPKKLVIADCGIVWIRDADGLSDFEKQSRIASVDLESFAVTSELYTANFGYIPPDSGFNYEVAVTDQGDNEVYYAEPGCGYEPWYPDTYIKGFDLYHFFY